MPLHVAERDRVEDNFALLGRVLLLYLDPLKMLKFDIFNAV